MPPLREPAREDPQLTTLRQVLAEARSARGRGKPADHASRHADELLLTLIVDHGYSLTDLSRATGWQRSALSMRLHRIRARIADGSTS